MFAPTPFRRSPHLAFAAFAGLCHAAAQQPSQLTPAAQQPLQTVQQTITVTADRGLTGVEDQATSVATLTPAQLAAPPALSLDDRLRQVAGFQLFRRTSSSTANPTTEGVSLRGLGSTAASRTLVVSDQVPLNDPFGGWIHWNEIPTLALAGADLVRGGSADLYGSSAIGGVIDLNPITTAATTPITVAADAFGATENSANADLLVSGQARKLNFLLAGSGLTTGGYIATAPASRGLVDVPSTVSQQSGRFELGHNFAPGQPTNASVFLRGNVLNESRGNGTPLTTNGTRLWRYQAGGDLEAGLTHTALRLFGDRETYRQTFSAITPNRSTEALTRLQRVPTDELGFSLTSSRAFGPTLTAALGLDARDIRATDTESPITANRSTSTIGISARQRDLGGFAEGIWQPKHWSVAASIRADSFRTFDGRQTSTTTPTLTPEPQVSELVASPHLGIVRQLPRGLALSANAFRAFRGPTLNELYRTGQVGQQTTLANPSLLAERATGFEFGAELTHLALHNHDLAHLRASYFWTEVNRPVSAVLLTQTATTQTLQRQNLGQIRSRGLSLEAQTTHWRGLDAGLGYQLAVATVTAFNTSSAAQANLTGNWIPQVPRHAAIATVNYAQPRLADLHLIATYSGQQYDDAANQYLLHPFARFDLSAERPLPHGLSLYAGAQNLLNRSIDAGRTPTLTLAAPRLVQAGLRWKLNR